MITVVFACPGRGTRAVLATALFNASVDRSLATAMAATRGPARADPAVDAVLREAGVIPGKIQATEWSDTLEESAHWLVTFDERSDVTRITARRSRWPVAEPESTEQLRAARDEIQRRVRALISVAGWSVGTWL